MPSNLLILILSIILLQGVCAVGFGQKERGRLTYEPGLTKAFGYILIPTSSSVLNYSVKITGSFADYMSLDPPLLENVPPNERPAFRVVFEMPDKLPENIGPGEHKQDINIVEEINVKGGLSVRTGALIRINVYVLYPTTYLTGSVQAANINEGEDLQVTVNAHNYGKQKINSVNAKIEILNSEEILQKTLYTQTSSIESNTNTVLTATGTSFGLKPGDYKAKATIYWDNNVTIMTNTFRIGALNALINDFTKEVLQGTINEFNIFVESLWNDELENVYAEITIGEDVIKTPTINIPAWKEVKLTGYWNTKNLPLGEYDTNIRILYPEGLIKSLDDKVIIKEEPPQINNEIDIQDNTTQAKKIPNTTIMMYVLSIAVLVLIIINAFTLKKHKKGK